MKLKVQADFHCYPIGKDAELGADAQVEYAEA